MRVAAPLRPPVLADTVAPVTPEELAEERAADVAHGAAQVKDGPSLDDQQRAALVRALWAPTSDPA